MNSQTSIREISVTPIYPPSANVFTTLVPVKNIQEKPSQLACLAHEIRNPLSTINLSAEMLKSAITDDDQKMFLDMIIRGSQRINDILTDLHSTFRADVVQSDKNSIHQLLDEVLAMARDKIMLKNIRIRKEYAAKDSQIVLNRPQMKIALTNIIINAVDAMTAGKGELRLITKSANHLCVVQIEDNGCGISRENIKNIFKPYFTNKPDGLGLGLAATQNILRSNHVRLNVKSAEAKGTSFILIFDKNRPLACKKIEMVKGCDF